MSSIFDSDSADFIVLINSNNQHSLWPAFTPSPSGWTILFGPNKKDECINFINSNWTDIRPQKLTENIVL